ncbi:MAG: radical SAM protein, partial [Clostridiales bacterium]|nr:radical SAM protein [Clostridiales bacterium]
MKNDLTLERYLNDGVASLIRDALKATWHNPRASAFWARYSLAAAKAEARRQKVEGCGEHAPLFLIASIASQCNLHCVGCYDRTNHIGAHIGAHISAASASRMEMSAQDWRRIFDQAEKLGVSAILLAGGEPLTRMDVIEEACRRPSILFPVFTNGTLMEGAVPRVFDAHRNLVPIVSLEGDENFTDARRGP